MNDEKTRETRFLSNLSKLKWEANAGNQNLPQIWQS